MRGLICSIFAIFLAGVASAQEKCIEISNDIERLACFDAMFQDIDKPALSPAEAYEAFEGILKSTLNEESFQDIHVIDSNFDPNTCLLGIINWYYGNKGRRAPSQFILITFVPLKDVRAHGRGVSLESVVYDFAMERGKFSFQIQSNEDAGEITDSDQVVAQVQQLLNVGSILSQAAMRGEDVSQVREGRDASVNIVTDESRVAAGEIMEALERLIDSCQK